MKKHQYQIQVKWTGNLGEGTKSYKGYSRNHEITTNGKPTIMGSSDPSFNGDPTRYNPEDLFVSTLASCHLLWYLHLCSVNKITVVEYVDNSTGTMLEKEDGSGAFEEVTLQPSITILEPDKKELAIQLHHEAHDKCFIANSVNFPVQCKPTILIKNVN